MNVLGPMMLGPIGSVLEDLSERIATDIERAILFGDDRLAPYYEKVNVKALCHCGKGWASAMRMNVAGTTLMCSDCEMMSRTLDGVGAQGGSNRKEREL